MKKRKAFGIIFFSLITVAVALGSSSFYQNQTLVQSEKINGIDVSAHQHRDLQGKPVSIDWPKVFEQGFKFTFVKASQGTAYANSYFPTDMVEGKNAGLLMGGYHYGEPNLYLDGNELSKDAENEARHFIEIAQNYLKGDYLRPVLDIEDASEKYPYWGVHYYNPTTGETIWNIDKISKKLGRDKTKERLSTWVTKWIEVVEEKTEPILYVNHNYAEHYLNESLSKYLLWFAWPSNEPNNPPELSFLGIWKNKGWDFWQYTWKGSVEGIKSHYVDLDLFNGNISRAYTFTIAPEVTPQPIACPIEKKLSIGQGVYVTEDGLRVRKEPGLDGEIIGKVDKGAPGVIQEGPVEKDGYTWWKVRYLSDTGWSAGEYLKPRLIIQPFGCLTEISLREFIEKAKEVITKKDVDFFIEKTNFQDVSCKQYREWPFFTREEDPPECLGREDQTLVASIFIGIIGSEGYPITKNEFREGLKQVLGQPEPSQLYGVIYPFGEDPETAHLFLIYFDPQTTKRVFQIFVLNRKGGIWQIEAVLVASREKEFKGLLDPESNLVLFYPSSPGNVFYQVEELTSP